MIITMQDVVVVKVCMGTGGVKWKRGAAAAAAPLESSGA
jgi:hypothetical protein